MFAKKKSTLHMMQLQHHKQRRKTRAIFYSDIIGSHTLSADVALSWDWTCLCDWICRYIVVSVSGNWDKLNIMFVLCRTISVYFYTFVVMFLLIWISGEDAIRVDQAPIWWILMKRSLEKVGFLLRLQKIK